MQAVRDSSSADQRGDPFARREVRSDRRDRRDDHRHRRADQPAGAERRDRGGPRRRARPRVRGRRRGGPPPRRGVAAGSRDDRRADRADPAARRRGPSRSSRSAPSRPRAASTTVEQAREAFLQIGQSVEDMSTPRRADRRVDPPDRRQRRPHAREHELRRSGRRVLERIDRAGLGQHRADQRLNPADRRQRTAARDHRRGAREARRSVRAGLRIALGPDRPARRRLTSLGEWAGTIPRPPSGGRGACASAPPAPRRP